VGVGFEESYVSRYPGGCRKHNFWTARVKSTENYIFGILMSRAIDWYMYIWVKLGRGEVGRTPGGVLSFFAGGLQFFSGPLPRNFKYIIGILSSIPVYCNL